RFILDDQKMLPLIEGRMVDHFDHRYASVIVEEVRTKVSDASSEFLSESQKYDPTHFPTPRHWVDEKEVTERLNHIWRREWFVGWRDITASTNQRTVIAAILPLAAVGHTTPLMFTDQDPRLVA